MNQNPIIYFLLVGWRYAMAYFISRKAHNMGRSEAGYFLLSFFVSPLFSFIILSLKGPTGEAMLRNAPRILYCAHCHSVYSDTENKKEKNYCPECGGLLLETTLLKSEWDRYTQSRKEITKNDFAKGAFIIRNSEVATPQTPLVSRENEIENKKDYDAPSHKDVFREENNIVVQKTETITCPNCKRVIPEGSQFCPFCGEEIHINKPVVIYCRQCGNKLVEGSAFCNKCGTRIIN